jgi:hypothetical protein
MDVSTLKEILQVMMEKLSIAQDNYNLTPTPFNEGVVNGWHKSISQVEMALAEELAQRDRDIDVLFADSLPEQLEGLSCKS